MRDGGLEERSSEGGRSDKERGLEDRWRERIGGQMEREDWRGGGERGLEGGWRERSGREMEREEWRRVGGEMEREEWRTDVRDGSSTPSVSSLSVKSLSNGGGKHYDYRGPH